MASHARAPSSSARRWSASTTELAYRHAGAVYRPRRPTETPLYPVVQHHLETFLAEAQEADPMGWGVPSWVERDFRDHASRGARLRCGILAHGFARVRCTDCGHDRLLAFSCKARGACPSCGAKRMAETAAHMVDHVFPHIPVRQFVLSVPKRLRPYLHHRPKTASAVLHILLRALQATLREACPTAPRTAATGAVSFLHRFGSSLNPHYHYHLCVVDGLFEKVEGETVQDPANPETRLRFHEATALTHELLESLQHTVRTRVIRHMVRHGLLARIYEVFPLICPTCQTPLTFIAFLTDPDPITRILVHIGEPTSPPLTHPARAPPQTELDMGPDSGNHHEVAYESFPDALDQSPGLPPLRSGEPAEHPLGSQRSPRAAGFDPTDPEPIPEDHFDQSWEA